MSLMRVVLSTGGPALPEEPSTHASYTTSVAPDPAGAPLAMERLGADDRSSRAPAMPSITQRPSTGSTKKQVSVAWAMTWGRVQDFPPSNERTRMCAPCPGVPTANWLATTYTTPWLSVRIVHPDRPKPCLVLNGLFDADVTCLRVQVRPPSLEVPTSRGWGAASPPLRLRKEARHTYTLPKNGLDEALSAQICSLSLNVVDDCLVTITGSLQAPLSPAAAAATSSVYETAIASNPLNVWVPGKFEVR